jgi:hypothetical protein
MHWQLDFLLNRGSASVVARKIPAYGASRPARKIKLAERCEDCALEVGAPG